ncbi:MAG: Glucokinase [Chlamydiae bacterium]|nr:Glucokinase [Chlamydiota bacterium]
MKLLAGDIGGTKTNLALFEEKEGDYTFSEFKSYPSQEYPDLKTIVEEYLISLSSPPIQKACFAIAGPVQEEVCRATNLPWVVDTKVLVSTLHIPHVFLLNDLEANAWALEILPEESLLEIYPGKKRGGNRGVVSPGTGLGEAGLYWDGERHHPFACEGGHCEFGPRDELQLQLSRYLQNRFGHASYERILSGPGLHTLYEFLRDTGKYPEPVWLKEALGEDDPSKEITIHALNKTSELCVHALDLFANILGSEAGNCALKFMATGGIYLGGGIPPKILPKLREPTFSEGFVDKGRFRDLLEQIPVWVILDEKAALKGAAHFVRVKRPR